MLIQMALDLIKFFSIDSSVTQIISIKWHLEDMFKKLI